MSNTFYGVLNNNLTTSKNCRRDAVHAAVEANGFVWGVATASGTLMVINRSEALAEKWLADHVEFVRQQNRWRVERGQPEAPTDGYSVVKVYAGKAAAEAACQPAEEPADRPNDARWVPACGGTETWAKARDGREYLYVWWSNAPEGTPASLRHGWLDRCDVIHHDDPNAAAEQGGSFPGLWKRPGGVEETITAGSHFG